MLTSSYIQSVFDYKDGNLYNKDFRGPRAIKGAKAGSIRKDGYVRTSVNKKSYLTHRLIWLWHNKELVDSLELDHINGNKSDNRIENLRQVTRLQNEWNKNHLGVGFQDGKWRARYRHKNKCFHIGMFETKEDAVAAYFLTIKPIRNQYLRSPL